MAGETECRLGIETLAGVIDGGGVVAANRHPRECVTLVCG